MNIQHVISKTHISVFCRHTTIQRSVAEADYHEWKNVWWISRILVHQNYRGRGIGSKLLKDLLALIRQIGPSPVVEVAPGGYNQNPEDQVAFYERNGFSATGQEGLYRLDLSSWFPEELRKGSHLES